MRTKRKLLISMLAIVFVLLAVVATVAIAFALTQQTITTTLNIGYVVEDIDGTASATYTIGGVTESLTAKKGNQVIGDTLVFHAEDTEDAGTLKFPQDALALTSQNDNVVIQYTYSNTGAKHYIASMSFDAQLKADNMKVEYSIDGTTYSEQRYAVVVPANTANKSYWIRISIDNKAKSASFTGDFNWLLNGCDEQSDEYLSLTSVEFQGSAGSYSASFTGAGSYVGQLVFPSSVNGDPVTAIGAGNLIQAQKNQVTSVYIPGSVTTIGEGAFKNFSNLSNVTIEEIEGLDSGETWKEIDEYYNFIIGQEAFYGCTSLTSFNFPANLRHIRAKAFWYSGLTSVHIPTDVTMHENFDIVGSNPFAYCENLESITGGYNAGAIGTFAIDNALYMSGGGNIWLVSTCKNSVIDTGIELDGGICSYAFAGRTDLTEFEFGYLVEIEIGAFEGCINLTRVVYNWEWDFGGDVEVYDKERNLMATLDFSDFWIPETFAQYVTQTYVNCGLSLPK